MNRNVKLLFVGLLAIPVATLAFGQAKPKAQEPATAKLQVTQCALRVKGMTCDSCPEMVKERLVKLEGVKTATVDYKTGTAQVQYDSKKINPEKIVAAFNRDASGFRVELSEPKAK
ncbi:MAG: cation transporter [Acidobacteria bacterium]|nr:cation transporter [Acidobacteriota bacterium]MCL5289020.1 cation transporter [Acidobacteriota bacterium]